MDSTGLLWLLAGVLMLVGLAGTLLPMLPGIPLMMIGMLIAAWAEDFTRIGWVTLVILGVLMGLSFVVELVAAALGAKRVGASRQAIAGAALGTLVGVFFGLPGMLVGPFVGAVAGELAARRDAGGALRAGVGAWVGFIVGTVAKLAVAFAMLGVFIAALIFD
ncbi:MAG: DUF456 domain-containing protein [Pseudomonadota bacterium]|nr:DUF456 domain-containing protein [Pseudomonadota bacterium]